MPFMPYRKIDALEYDYVSAPTLFWCNLSKFSFIRKNILNPLEQTTSKVELDLKLNGHYPPFYEFKDKCIYELETIAGELTRNLQKEFLKNPNDVGLLETGHQDLKNKDELQERIRKTVPDKFDIEYLHLNLYIVDDIFWLTEEIENENS